MIAAPGLKVFTFYVKPAQSFYVLRKNRRAGSILNPEPRTL